MPETGSPPLIGHRQAGELNSDKAPGDDPCPSSASSQPRSRFKFHNNGRARPGFVQRGLCGGAAPHESLIIRRRTGGLAVP